MLHLPLSLKEYRPLTGVGFFGKGCFFMNRVDTIFSSMLEAFILTKSVGEVRSGFPENFLN
jgi:hypothetical protein